MSTPQNTDEAQTGISNPTRSAAMMENDAPHTAACTPNQPMSEMPMMRLIR